MDMSGSILSLSWWPIFSLLDASFLKEVKMACVFGSTGNEALVVTHEDEVYALGSNSSSCLGLGDLKSSFQPRKVDTLCKQGLVDIAYGSGPHVIMLTSQGELYSCGHNSYGQLGHSCTSVTGQGMFPRRIVDGVTGVRITKVACGGHHSLALGPQGEVFAWGYNNCGQIGSGDTVNQTAPRKVNALNGKPCMSIACAQASAVALTQTGELYSWGYNGNGQLGIGSTINQNVPVNVDLPGVFIAQGALMTTGAFSRNVCKVIFRTQVVCGYAHMMGLSDKGELYVWGSNVYGQLGTGLKVNALSPVEIRVGTEPGRVTGVAACHNSHISGATVLNGKVFMWGMCRSQNVLSPLETPFSTLDEIFAYFASPASMWRTVVLDSDEPCGLLKCIASCFDDDNTSDLTLMVEGKKIHVHKAILRIRCKYFHSMFQQGRWDESEKDLIEICQFSYSVYYAFLNYLYTDKVDELSTDNVISLLDLADSYCEAELKKRCERLLWQRVSTDNVAVFLAVAAKYKAEALEEHCFTFALNHMTQVVQSEGFSQLDDSLAKQFIQKAANRKAFKT